MSTTASLKNTIGNKKVVESAIFNDLLPAECSVDKSTVFVKPITSSYVNPISPVNNLADSYETQKASGTLAAGRYSVTFTENYEGSGKKMMTIKPSKTACLSHS